MSKAVRVGILRMGKILVVDDEQPIAEILKYNLEQEGYHVLLAYDGDTAIDIAFKEKPSLIVLDIMLPQKDGFTVCREIRAKMKVPIIMLSAREAEIDKILGLELGADDYVTKPFSAREVVARVKALLRRVQMEGSEQKKEPLTCGSLRIDEEQMEVFKGDKKIDLSYREYSLLLFLLRNSGHVFSREKLLDAVWGYDFYGDDRTVDVTIRRLREKIEDNPSQPQYIQTRRGAGYYLRRP
ncbi:MAG: winged helix-turn-helix domain-containing protein [Dethiobacteria bacterium]